MRTLPLVVLTALALTQTPSEAVAHGKKPQHGKHHNGKHQGNGQKPGQTQKPGTGAPSKPTPVVARLRGAGQRLNFSFGGQIDFTASSAKGEFAVVAHPEAPAGTTLSVLCQYNSFRSPSLQGNTLTFEARGRCGTLSTDGTFGGFDAVNLIQIVDNPNGDAIDVNFVGNAGISIAGGTLSFGNFELVTGNT